MTIAMAPPSKSQLRIELSQQRNQYVATHGGKANGQKILDVLTSAAIIPSKASIGGYWPVKSEVDIRPLLLHFYKQEHLCALPVVQGRKNPLIFREWHPGDLLVSGIYNILTPDEAAPLVIPAVLLVPILGFDKTGHRLGHGEGYYDQTLESLRAQHSLIAIGIAFDCQEVEAIPSLPHDELMDYIVTPTRVMKFRNNLTSLQAEAS